MRIVSMYVARMWSHGYVEARDCMRSVHVGGRTFPSFLGNGEKGTVREGEGERGGEKEREEKARERERERKIGREIER